MTKYISDPTVFSSAASPIPNACADIEWMVDTETHRKPVGTPVFALEHTVDNLLLQDVDRRDQPADVSQHLCVVSDKPDAGRQLSQSGHEDAE